jgi:ribonucleoside-diphosphate reductase alpha chain
VDGEITIEDLFKKWNNNESIPAVLSRDISTGKDEVDLITNVQKTRENANIIRLEFDDGTFLELTPDHRVYTSNRGYVPAAQLTPEDEVELHTD